MYINAKFFMLQALRKITSSERLPPPPGCPEAIYSLMISCWYASLDTCVVVYCV